VFGGTRPVTGSSRPSREATAPYRVFNLESLAPLLVRRSPHALCLYRLSFRVFTFQIPEKHIELLPGILSWASAPLQRQPKHRAAA